MVPDLVSPGYGEDEGQVLPPLDYIQSGGFEHNHFTSTIMALST
jgi:hypothetical protein